MTDCEKRCEAAIERIGYVVAAMQTMNGPTHWIDRLMETMVVLGWRPRPGQMPPGIVEEIERTFGPGQKSGRDGS